MIRLTTAVATLLLSNVAACFAATGQQSATSAPSAPASPASAGATGAAAMSRTAAVPAAMVGTWAHGSCAVPANRVTITAGTAALGTAKAQPIVYYPNDQGPGNGAIHWTAEGDVDNFVYDPASKTLVHNVQGYHMPGAVAYTRCP